MKKDSVSNTLCLHSEVVPYRRQGVVALDASVTLQPSCCTSLWKCLTYCCGSSPRGGDAHNLSALRNCTSHDECCEVSNFRLDSTAVAMLHALLHVGACEMVGVDHRPGHGIQCFNVLAPYE